MFTVTSLALQSWLTLGRADYKVSLRGLSGAALETQRNACHARGAERLQRLCFANGGVYVKLGQHIAQLVGWRCLLELS